MCFGRENGPMGPGAVVVSVEAREWCEDCKTMHHLSKYPSGMVLYADWEKRTCAVEWDNGENSTVHFREVDVLRWQTSAPPPENMLDCHDHE